MYVMKLSYLMIALRTVVVTNILKITITLKKPFENIKEKEKHILTVDIVCFMLRKKMLFITTIQKFMKIIKF